MENLSMCRICLATDVRFCSIASHLRDMYERITAMTFKREDRRPVVACYICHAKLQSCYRLRTSCLQSDELLTDMMNGGELKPQDVLSTNTLSIMSVLQLSLGHALQDSTECHIKKEDSEVIHEAELDQHNIGDIKIEPQEEYDAQLDDNNQCSHLEDPLETGARVSKLNKIAVLKDTEDATTNRRKRKVEKNEVTENITVKEPKIVTKEIRVAKPVTTRKIIETCEKLDFKLNKCENVVTSIVNNIREENSTNDTCLKHTVSIPISKNNQFSSDTCKKGFSCESHLNILIHTHTGDEPYACNICKKRFNQKGDLTRHIRTHTGERPYQCTVCKKCFIRKSCLDKHILTHSGEKPYKCTICKKCFIQKCNLENHIRTHTGEKPYQCTFCKKCFSASSNYARHILIHKR